MNFAESIKKARERGMQDEQILEAIKKQNPHKEDFFNKEKEKGLTSTNILDNIISEEKIEKKVIVEQPPIPPEIKGHIPPKPTEETKIWMRIFITLNNTLIFFLSVFLRIIFF